MSHLLVAHDHAIAILQNAKLRIVYGDSFPLNGFYAIRKLNHAIARLESSVTPAARTTDEEWPIEQYTEEY